MKYGGLSLNIYLDELQMTSRPDWNDELIAGNQGVFNVRGKGLVISSGLLLQRQYSTR
jgi:hypothetical protein